MRRLVFHISLTIQGPLLSKSSNPGSYGLDAVMARNHQGMPVLNGSHIAGKLRDAWLDLGLDHGDDLLGKANDTGDYAPIPKRLYFSDFILANDVTAGIRHRIRMDAKRQSVQKGAICFAEDLFLSGGKYTFTGQCTCIVKDDKATDEISHALNAGLKFIPQFGGERTVGLGRLLAVEISQETFDFTLPAATHAYPGGLGLVIKPHAPFCFAQRKVADNLFESSAVIPGAAIAGSLATLWRQLLGGKTGAIDENFDQDRHALGKYFDEIRFLNALPGLCEKKRPVQWPYSLVQDNNGKVWDVAPFPGPILINNNSPAFFVDWKNQGEVAELFGWAAPASELRGRTAMHRELRRAKDQALFAYEMIIPDDVKWYGRIAFSGSIPATERPAIADQLASLLRHGLVGLGKTKAEAEVEIMDPAEINDAQDSLPLSASDPIWYLTLQSPAILCEPTSLNEESRAGELHQAYASVWRDLSRESIELCHFFARQSLAGGNYLWNRFQRDKAYSPWLLTEAGSVFALRPVKGKETTALQHIQGWCRQGLDIPNWAVNLYKNASHPGDHWTTCPFLPQHGFGECRVNLTIHQEKKLEQKDFQLIHSIEDLLPQGGDNEQ